MSRAIKFRAWDKNAKIMLYRVCVGNTLTDDPCSVVWDESKKDWLNFDNACGFVMEFIERRDKNGKEIYEGDVVREYDADGKNPSVYPVEFIDKGWAVGDDIEVIGNIFENSDLIKGGNK